MASISEIKSSITFGGGLARTNKFLVSLPSLGSGGIVGFLGSRNMNILCRTAQIPGKQVTTHEKRIGMKFEKVAYGYAVEDVTLTFMETALMPIRRYFDEWRELILNEDAQTAAYKTEYQKRVVISQLAMPLPFGALTNIPIDVNASTYSVELVNAFPTTITSVDYNNEADGFVETTVSMSYTNWKRVSAGQLSFSINF
jgi:hypothetical protein|tara:strand:- start:8322 stop:8918 length:597 start_codon:yes stop_codon:yes gene_type:complete